MKDLSKLQTFADHLVHNADKLIEKYRELSFLKIAKGNNLIFWDNVYYLILPWWEEEMTVVFKNDFSHNHKKHVIFHPNPKISVSFILGLYFNLPSDAFVHCFFIGQQDPKKYGGRNLTVNSTPKDCGLHLRSYIAKKKKEWRREEEVLERKVLVEKSTRPMNKFFIEERLENDF